MLDKELEEQLARIKADQEYMRLDIEQIKIYLGLERNRRAYYRRQRRLHYINNNEQGFRRDVGKNEERYEGDGGTPGQTGSRDEEIEGK